MFQDRSLVDKIKMRVKKEFARISWPLSEMSHRQYFQDFPFLYAFEVAGGNDLPGDYYEFGVWKGRSFVKAFRQARLYFSRHNFKSMRFVAFDSFEGLPESDERFLPSGYGKGAFSATRTAFEQACRKAGVDKTRLHIVPGFYSELREDREDVRALSGSKIAVCYIDCDVYEGARDALDFIASRLQTGSMLIIDDWNRHHAVPTAGLRRAVKEWLVRNPQIELSQIFCSKRVLFSVLVKDKHLTG